MTKYAGVAGELGITDEEIGAVMGNVMLVSGGRVRTQFRMAMIEAKKARRKNERLGEDASSGG